MKAIAKLLLGTVTLATIPVSSAQAGSMEIIQGAVAAAQSVGQASGATDAERKQSAEQWLKLARQSLRDGNVEQATKYVERAEKLNVKFDSFLARFGDTPEKVRRDIAAAKPAAKPAANSSAPPSQRFNASRPDSAQTTSSGPVRASISSPPVEPGEGFSNDTKARAKRYLENGRNALRQGSINEAIAWRQKAAGTNATFAAGEYSPAELGRELQQAGVDPNRLAANASPSPFAETPDDVSPNRPARLPPIESARAIVGAGVAEPETVTPTTPPTGLQYPMSASQTNAKAAAIRLSTQAQAALDKGDLQSAKKFSDQAEAIRVPEAAFVDGDLRPWEVGLRVQSAFNRRVGVQPAANYESVPAVAIESSNKPSSNSASRYPVAQGVYNPSMDRSRNVLVQGQIPTPIADTPVEAQPANNQPNSAGLQLYQQGMTALESQDRAAALQAFREAWKYERELPVEVRRQLRDKLSLLSQSNAPQAPSGEAPTPLEEVESTQHLLYQKLYREISAEEQKAKQLTGSDPKGALEKMQQLRGRVNDAELDSVAKKQLLTFVDRSINGLESYIEQNRSEIDLNEKNKRILNEMEGNRLRKFETDDKIAELVDQYNKLVDEERFPEAEIIAKQVKELAPENPISRTLMTKGAYRIRLAEQDAIRDRKEKGFYDAMASVDGSSEPFDDRRVIDFGDIKGWKDMSTARKESQRQGMRRLSPAEIEIRKSLSKQVDVRFTERPLLEVMETLGSLSGINIHLDPAGLASEGVTPSQPVTLNFQQPISLKSVLILILEPLRLSFDVRNEVLLITSEQMKDRNCYPRTYYVADLIVPIPNFIPGYDMGLPAAIREAHQVLGYGGMIQPVSTNPMGIAQDSSNQNGGNASILAQYAANSKSSLGNRPTNPIGLAPGSMGGAALADFDTLIELIQQTIAPDSWADAGGSGAIESFPTNLSLVISQTQDVHDQISDLLEQLRRLQDLQVAIEVRFIRLTDNFFERIGVDFDVRLDDNAVRPLRRDDQGRSLAIGLDSAGLPTQNLDIPFNTGNGPGSGSFALSVPAIGGFGANGPGNAFNFGVAILSDLETFFLLQAATGDVRSNVLQAPKVTLFNGQTASVADTSQRPFVTSLIPVVGDFAAAHQPVITVLNEGTQLGVQAVVSSDRRFVRLTLVPFFSQIGDVQEFTFQGSSTTDTGTNVVDANGQPTGAKNNTAAARTGTTVQLPTFSFTTVSTTVSVPDGGTVLLGGIKRLNEQRNEQGVPMLNKLPYVNRLFKNVGIGRETASLMLMVTPRIIIQEEEEQKLGIDVTP